MEDIKLCLRQLLVCATFINQSSVASPELADKLKEAVGITKQLQEKGKTLKSIDSLSDAHNNSQDSTLIEIVKLAPAIIRFVSAAQKIGTGELSQTELSSSFSAIIELVKTLSVLAKSLTFNTGSNTFPLYK